MDTNSVSTGCRGGLTVAAPGDIAIALPFIPFAAIPEPATYEMMLAGLGLLGWVKRRRNQQAV